MEKGETNILGGILFTLVIIIISVLVLAIYQSIETYRHCAKWEEKKVWQNAYTSYVYSGKVMIPIYHKAEFITKNMCVEPK